MSKLTYDSTANDHQQGHQTVGTRGRHLAQGRGHSPRCRMSLEAMLWALKQAPDVPSQCLGVLMGLAEGADKHGRGAYPSALTLAAYARKSERQARTDLGLLTEAKLIRPGNQSLAAHIHVSRRPVVYDLAMEHVCDLQSTAPRGKPRGAHSRRPDLQPTAPREETGLQSTAGVQPTAPQMASDLQEHQGMQPTAPQEDDVPGCSPASSGVQSTADKPNYLNPKSKPSSRRRDLNEGRDDVKRVCAHLADRIEGNTGERPAIGKGWLDAARLMIDNDKRTEEQIHKAIDWCQDSEFWYQNVLSMPKLRGQYQQLRVKAQAEQRKRADTNGSGPSGAPGPDRARGWMAAGRAHQEDADEARREITS